MTGYWNRTRSHNFIIIEQYEDEMITKLKFLTEAYAETQDGAWLNDFDWMRVPVRFKKLKHDVIGYHFFGKITLMEVCDVSLIFDIYIHELRHVWQSKKQPLRYLAGKLFRRLIEDDADAEEFKALKWYNNREKKCAQ